MIRAFIAIPIAQPIRKKLIDFRDDLRRAEADVKWVEEANLHLTLKFLGWIDETSVEKLKALLAAETLRWPAIHLEYGGLGTFPERGTPRVVWAGCAGDVAKLSDLARAVERAAEEIGVAPEERPFSAHLTLGRVKSSRNARGLREAIEKRRGAPLGPDTVREVVLFESKLRPSGPIYEALAAFPLGGNERG